MLTDSVIASNQIESSKRYEGRKKRFIDSKRWKFLNGIYKIKHGNFNIEIHKYEADYYIKLETLQGKKTFKSLEIAKEHIFDVIENGEFIKYLQRHKINIDDIYIRK